jgi:lipopolysaccharide/colanic/teichoic acid biosynthesis glycosyltransferase
LNGLGQNRSVFLICKRVVDVTLSAAGLLLAAPLMAVVAVAIRVSSPGPAVFRQKRMGRGCKPFLMLKFRTMYLGAHENGPLVTSAGDVRVTPLGRLLRRYKLDELPQFWNVLKGDMSLVGPRPQTRQYFELYRDEYAEVLEAVRPGITDFAAISYRDEEGVLARLDEPEAGYIRHVIPEKLRLYRLYVERMSVLTDLYILARTIGVLLSPRRSSGSPGEREGTGTLTPLSRLEPPEASRREAS